MRVLVLAAGNDARGDDAPGPMLSARLAAMKLPGLTVIDAFQFQVEHALDLAAADMALFIDAHLRQEAPVRLAPVVAAADCGEGSHALSPAQVLAVAARYESDGRSFVHASPDGRPDDPRLDISHESLIRQWQRLRDWVAALPLDCAIGLEVPMIERFRSGMTPREHAAGVVAAARALGA